MIPVARPIFYDQHKNFWIGEVTNLQDTVTQTFDGPAVLMIDLDGTLVDTETISLFSDPGTIDYHALALKWAPNAIEEHQLRYQIAKSKLSEYRRLLHADTNNALAALQDKVSAAFILTSRKMSAKDFTCNEVQRLKINLKKYQKNTDGQFTLANNRKYLAHNQIILTNRENKGEVAADFLSRHQINFQTLVFVDNDITHIIDMRARFAAKVYENHKFHLFIMNPEKPVFFQGTLEFVARRVQAKALFHLGLIMSDEQVKIVLEEARKQNKSNLITEALSLEDDGPAVKNLLEASSLFIEEIQRI